MLRTQLRKALSFLRQPVFVQVWFIPLCFALGISRAFIFTASFKRLTPYLGESVVTHPYIPLVTADHERRALQIGRAVLLASRYAPWDSNCFVQAVAARFLLGIYGIPYAIFFGVMRDPVAGDMKAHAWVAAGRVPVTGGAGFDRFTVVGVFVNPRFTDVTNLNRPPA